MVTYTYGQSLQVQNAQHETEQSNMGFFSAYNPPLGENTYRNIPHDRKYIQYFIRHRIYENDYLVNKFTEKNLRRACSQELADIISIIRYAAKGGELLTAERRVDKALMKIKSDRSFTGEQNKWLDLIRRHLIENLLMEDEDIETLPIFTREGASWSKLNRVFSGELETIIHEINEAIAA
jgi:hypothetical protein